MNARQVEVFRAMMRNGTVTAAAEVLNISQPAVSKSLRTLEAEIGFRLFERLGGRLVPTAEAQLLVADAERIFRELESLKALSERIRDNQIGMLRIGASAPATFGLLPQALDRFRLRFPSIRLAIMTLPAEQISERILLGDIDLGLTLQDLDQPGTQSQVICNSAICVVLPLGSPLLEKDVISAQDLGQEALISYGSDTHHGRLLDRAFQSRGQIRNTHVEVTLSISALPLVRSGLGVALVDDLVPWETYPGLATRRFAPKVGLEVSMTTNTKTPKSRFVPEFARDLKAVARELRKQDHKPA